MNHVSLRALMIGLMIVVLSSLAQATSFIIELTNGNAVSTPYVWEEGDEVKFFMYHGTAGVPKALVKRITPSARVDHDKSVRSAPSQKTGDVELSMTDTPAVKRSPQEADVRRREGNLPSEHEQQNAGDMRPEANDVSADRAKKSRLTSQLDDATKRYREASEGGNLDAKQAALNEMRAYRKKILELSDEVKQKHAGVPPTWWNE